MRPKNKKGKRWHELTFSPKYHDAVAWKQYAVSVRQILKEPALPPGLAGEEYLRTKLARFIRFDELFQHDLRRRQAELANVNHRTSSDFTSVGQLPIDPEILVVADYVWKQLLKELAVNPRAIKSISHRAFEELVAFLFEKFGYRVELT